MMLEKCYTTKELSELLGHSRRYWQRVARDIEGTKQPGRQLYIPESGLDKWLAENSVEPERASKKKQTKAISTASKMVKTKNPGIYYRVNKEGTKIYYLRISINRRQTWIAAGNYIEDAKTLRRKYKIAIAEGTPGAIRPEAIDFGKLAKQYYQYYIDRAAERNHARTASIIDTLVDFFRGIEVSAISPFSINGYISKRKSAGIAARTINTELDYLRSMLNRAVEWGYIDQAPKIKHLKYQKKRERHLSEGELEIILENVSEAHRDAILIALDTGLRLGELYRLKPKDVDYKRNMIHIQDTKSSYPRSIPLTARVKKILKRHFAQSDKLFGVASENVLSNKFTLERKRLYPQVEPWRFHDLRHTWATRLVERGVDPYTLMELGGWSKLEMVTRYLHTSRERKRAAIDTLENYGE